MAEYFRLVVAGELLNGLLIQVFKTIRSPGRWVSVWSQVPKLNPCWAVIDTAVRFGTRRNVNMHMKKGAERSLLIYRVAIVKRNKRYDE